MYRLAVRSWTQDTDGGTKETPSLQFAGFPNDQQYIHHHCHSYDNCRCTTHRIFIVELFMPTGMNKNAVRT